jgi:hypothetical protein
MRRAVEWMEKVKVDLQSRSAVGEKQAAEGLCHWAYAEMKQRSEDWPILDGQVLNYIAWK